MGNVAHATISEPISAHCVNEWCDNSCVRRARETITTALSTWTNGLIVNMTQLRYAGKSIRTGEFYCLLLSMKKQGVFAEILALIC